MAALLGLASGGAWAQDTVRVKFEDASPRDVVAFAARVTGKDGYVARGTVGEIDVSTGPVSPDAALGAIVTGLERAGLRVTVTEVAVVVRDPALPADAPLVAVVRATPAGIPTGDCPGVTSRAALGRIDGPPRVFGSPVRSEGDAAPGLRLSGIPRGGPVSALGLRSGDVLESIDGPVRWRPPDGVPALKATLGAALEVNVPVTFRVRRRGSAETWTCHVKRPEREGAEAPAPAG